MSVPYSTSFGGSVAVSLARIQRRLMSALGRRCSICVPLGRKTGAVVAVPVVRTIAVRLSASVAQSPSGPASSTRNQVSLPSAATSNWSVSTQAVLSAETCTSAGVPPLRRLTL